MNDESKKMILGFDPGRDKCGIAVTDDEQNLYFHEVVGSEKAIATLKNLCQQFPIDSIVMGDRTTAKIWQQKIGEQLFPSLPLILIDERNSTLEARDRYWQMYPPKGLQRLIPEGMRLPPRPIDDIVAILLIERYLKQ